jgi:S-adenosylmethionine:tRNA ribosyltransferase-isomerase
MQKSINIHDYTYPLPPERIAMFPLEKRDDSKLLVYRKGSISHERFYNLSGFLPEHCLLCFNNTRVIQARILFQKESGASIEVFLLNPVIPSPLLLEAMQSTRECTWKCIIGNLKRWKTGTILTRPTGSVNLKAELVNRRVAEVRFSWEGDITFAGIISEAGLTPLPPYLKRDPVASDRERYQTVYSQPEGAVAAPTAGLHFTPEVMASLEKKHIKTDFVTLHVSAGTFQPVKVENALEHVMHQEQIIINRRNVETLRTNEMVIPVGTTSMRTLESLYWFGVKCKQDRNCTFSIGQDDCHTLPQDVTAAQSLDSIIRYMDERKTDTLTGETSIYITPGYSFRICRGLITNFHQPGSTLILLVAALIGEQWKTVYNEALANDYRFLSYGDSSLLIP